ncbi:hypothetical protein HPP92_016473 [Vanilla planifolia]|uniref:EF-hand domain-containing protein n=1 Tax=Vanilla planifolia TaxID=51239 RepID=A0A835QQC3_VANPL|nr:hypothetical protein HPP92_017009 [Vanilla planifolia]KAG0471927.1 hypothetical protein HPP92_016473 [Vanilla planifolia]
MALRFQRPLRFLERSGFRWLSSVAGVNAGEGNPSSSSNGIAAYARVAAGIIAFGSSGLGLWFLPASPERSFTDSSSDPRLIAYEGSSAAEKQPWFLLRDSFRRRMFFKYEKRLRLRSSPEKIFEYFASFKGPSGEVFMSAADLMRAVIPVFPPSESHVVREGYLRGERKPGALQSASSPLFLLFCTDNDGLISFPEYIFFVTLLSISDSSFSAAFKIFDLDNDGEIGLQEFKKLMALMRSCNRQGAAHQNGLRVGLKVKDCVEDAGVVEYLFGMDGNQRLQHDKFVQFLRDLHDEILRLEFDHYDVETKGSISAKDFALSMVSCADIKNINKFLDRVDVLDNNLYLKDKRITFEEFKAFADLRKRLHLLPSAFSCFEEVHGLLTKEDFRGAAFHVSGVCLSENVVDVVFHVFDCNTDGSLSTEEFLRVMQKREIDVRQPISTGFLRHRVMLS